MNEVNTPDAWSDLQQFALLANLRTDIEGYRRYQNEAELEAWVSESYRRVHGALRKLSPDRPPPPGLESHEEWDLKIVEWILSINGGIATTKHLEHMVLDHHRDQNGNSELIESRFEYFRDKLVDVVECKHDLGDELYLMSVPLVAESMADWTAFRLKVERIDIEVVNDWEFSLEKLVEQIVRKMLMKDLLLPNEARELLEKHVMNTCQKLIREKLKSCEGQVANLRNSSEDILCTIPISEIEKYLKKTTVSTSHTRDDVKAAITTLSKISGRNNRRSKMSGISSDSIDVWVERIVSL